MTKVRKRTVLKSLARQWSEWTQTPITPTLREKYPLLKHCTAIYSNSRYEVQLFPCASAIGGVMQMTAVRHGDIEPISWAELQRIKLELFGPEATAVEVYPPVAEEWHPNINLRVLWILPGTWQLPFGLTRATAWGNPE